CVAWDETRGAGAHEARHQQDEGNPNAGVHRPAEPRSTPQNRPYVDGSKPANGVGGVETRLGTTACGPPTARCGGWAVRRESKSPHAVVPARRSMRARCDLRHRSVGSTGVFLAAPAFALWRGTGDGRRRLVLSMSFFVLG